MNVLIVGSGAREHALTWMALKSPLSRAVYCAPGNAATGAIAVNLPVAATDADAIVRLTIERNIDLTILGPEMAVAAGVADAILTSGTGLVFGPTADAGRIESSKAFAKDLMSRAGVVTPAHRVFSDSTAAKDYVRAEGRGFVVKADGLAKGKGTLVGRDTEDTLEAIDSLTLSPATRPAAQVLIVEEKVEGPEVSLMALVDGERVVPLPPACDYKRALDGDRGPNTGGMGGYSPPGFFSAEMLESACQHALLPVVQALKEAGTAYRGCLYAGLIITKAGIQVLEFNARMGDPEAQVVLPRLESDLLPHLAAAARGQLTGQALSWSPRVSVGVVLASAGYPGDFTTGHLVEGLSSLEQDVFVFHAGTAASAQGYRTSGGRVLTLVALDQTVSQARDRAYRSVDRVRFSGKFFRSDVALREVATAVSQA